MIRSYRKSTHILILLISFLLFGFILVFSLGSLNSGVSVQGHSTMVTAPEQAMYPRAKPNSPYVSLYDSTNEEVSSNEEFSVTNKLTLDADGLIRLTDNVIFMVDMPEDAVTL